MGLINIAIEKYLNLYGIIRSIKISKYLELLPPACSDAYKLGVYICDIDTNWTVGVNFSYLLGVAIRNNGETQVVIKVDGFPSNINFFSNCNV